MRISLFSRFAPAVGGIETLASILVPRWVAAGHEVEILTDIQATVADEAGKGFRVVHSPTRRRTLESVSWADITVHNNISLKVLWPILLAPRPLVAVHHGCHQPYGARPTWRGKAKIAISRSIRGNISCSAYCQRTIGVGGIVVANCYDDTTFRVDEQGSRDMELAFVGRLVSDKGVDVLLKALAMLRQRGAVPRLTVIGDGPERVPLEQFAKDSGIADQVTFVGMKQKEEVAKLLNRHHVLVIPSLWDEPFGIVALEGIACGCVVVGSSGGGLPEAIGPSGETFPNGDEVALASTLENLLSDDTKMETYRKAAPAHLAMHTPHVVAKKYLDYFEQFLADKGRQSGKPRGQELS